MVVQIHGIGNVGIGAFRARLDEGDDGFVTAIGVLGASEGVGLIGNFSGHDLRVAGSIFGHLGGVRLGDNPVEDHHNTVTVLKGGMISADFTNEDGGAMGLQIFGAAARVINAGVIEGYNAIRLNGAGNGVTRIENSGLIRGVVWAINVDAASTERVYVLNTGNIIGSGFAIHMSNAASNDIVINRKYIRGDVHLGGGNDLFDGRFGTVSDLDGGILGQAGDDTFMPGLSAEWFIGGEAGMPQDNSGMDTVDYSTWRRGVWMSLIGAFDNTGAAAGDLYIGIDIFKGSALGNDKLQGDANANTFYGNGGADSLWGEDGDDVLIGGRGGDLLSGGGGNDTFRFLSRSEGTDRITDFGAEVGNDDVIAISARGFGGGLRAGVELREGQFRVSARGNVALDRDDRFVFRSSDQTLWFDIDGKGGKGPVKIADLQPGAELSSVDLLLI